MHRIPLLTAMTATLALAAAAPALATGPANDDVADATMIAGSEAPAPKAYTLASAGLETSETHWKGSEQDTVWFKWTPYATGAAYANVCNAPSGEHVTRVWRLPEGKALTADNLVVVTFQPSYNPVKSTSCLARFKGMEKTTYYIQVDRMPGAAANHVLEIAQDTVAPPEPVITAPGAVSGSTVTADFTVSDDTFGATCGIEGSAPIDCAPGGTVFDGITEGEKTLFVRAYDAMGNPSQLAYKEFIVDPSIGKPVTPAGAANPVLPATGDAPKPAVAPPAPPVVDPRAALVPPCTLSLKAPKKVSRKALRKGLRKGVRLTVKTTGGCTAKVALKRRGRRVTVVATAGSLTRSAIVKVA